MFLSLKRQRYSLSYSQTGSYTGPGIKQPSWKKLPHGGSPICFLGPLWGQGIVKSPEPPGLNLSLPLHLMWFWTQISFILSSSCQRTGEAWNGAPPGKACLATQTVRLSALCPWPGNLHLREILLGSGGRKCDGVACGGLWRQCWEQLRDPTHFSEWLLDLRDGWKWVLVPVLSEKILLLTECLHQWVFLDYRSGQVSSYDMRDRSPIYTYPRLPFSGTMRPFFRLRSVDSLLFICQAFSGAQEIVYRGGTHHSIRNNFLVSEPSREALAISTITDSIPCYWMSPLPSGHIREPPPKGPLTPLQTPAPSFPH